MESKLKLILEDYCLIGRHGDFGAAIHPLEDDIEKVMIAVCSGLEDATCVDLDGNFDIISIYQLQDNTSKEEISKFTYDNIQIIIDKVYSDISNMI